MYPQYPYPPPPPPPQRRGLSTLTIVLIVLGGFLLLGFGTCVVLGGLVVLGAASAEKEALDAGLLVPGTVTAPNAEPGSTGAPPPTVLGDNDEDGDGANGDDAKDNSKTGATSPGQPAVGTTKWMCNATGWVRVCGFANVCNNMMMSGTGVGTDRQSAYNMAKLACEGMIRARGGYGTCNVACTPNAH